MPLHLLPAFESACHCLSNCSKPMQKHHQSHRCKSPPRTDRRATTRKGQRAEWKSFWRSSVSLVGVSIMNVWRYCLSPEAFIASEEVFPPSRPGNSHPWSQFRFAYESHRLNQEKVPLSSVAQTEKCLRLGVFPNGVTEIYVIIPFQARNQTSSFMAQPRILCFLVYDAVGQVHGQTPRLFLADPPSLNPRDTGMIVL